MFEASVYVSPEPRIPPTASCAASLKSEIVDAVCEPVWFARASGSVANLDKAIAAAELMSAFTIVSFAILADVTAESASFAVSTAPF